MPAAVSNLARQWTLANTAAMLAAYLVYTPIAHGVTGSHGRDLNREQIIAHSIALAVVAVLVASAQRRVLMRFVAVPWHRVAITAVLFINAFWIGYYQPFVIGPDTDVILGFLVLGSAVWTGHVATAGHRAAAAVAVLAFPLAGVVGELCLLAFMALTDVRLDPRTHMIHHSVFWLTTGGMAGLLGGWVSGLALQRMLSTHLRTLPWSHT